MKNRKFKVAWSIIYQILSQSEESLKLRMTHPCNKQYKCLAIVKGSQENWQIVIVVNLNGTGILIDNQILNYENDMNDQDIKILVRRIFTLAGLRMRNEPRFFPGVEFVLALLSNSNNDIRVLSAWEDSSFQSRLSGGANSFLFYLIQSHLNENDHLPRWIILYDHKIIAICDFETDRIITLSGKRFNIKTEKEEALKAVLLAIEFYDVIEKTRNLLLNNLEWQARYATYGEEISKNKDYLKSIGQKFRKWPPLRVYLNVSNAKNYSYVKFELRYLGQTVADLTYHKKADVLLLDTSKYDSNSKRNKVSINKRDFDCEIELKKEKWDGSKASEFRAHFRNRKSLRNNDEKDCRKNEEHRLESLLLSEFLETTDKKICQIKPVTIADLRFPMPTPLSASNHTLIKYSSAFGGGIDIFARIGTGGKATNLCIMELKDENTKKEPPKEVVKQALVYAVFIHDLLRSTSGQKWWNLFGFSGAVPEKLVIFAACVMPSNENNDTFFEGTELSIGKDIIKLHYLYFTEEQNSIKNIQTSLPLKIKAQNGGAKP